MIEVVKSATFDRWLRTLKDRRAAARVQVRIDRLAAEWKRNDARRVEGGIVHYRLDILQEANEILCDLEEKVSGLPRPRDVRRYWQRS